MGLLDKLVFRGQASDVKKGKDIQREREEWEKERAAAAQKNRQQVEQVPTRMVEQVTTRMDEQVPTIPAPVAGPVSEQGSGQEITPKSRLYNEAEALRKAGRVHEAELKYLDSIKEEEKESPKASWRQTGPAPTRYEALAKMYYNTNRDELALQVMDKYLSYCKDCGKEDLRMKKLRASMADSSLKRMLIKGWAYSVDDSGDSQAV